MSRCSALTRGRVTLLALVLTGFAPGAGHVYLGRPLRGAAWATALGAALVGWVLAVPRSYDAARLGLLPPLGLAVAVLADVGRLGVKAELPLPWRPAGRWALVLASVVLLGFVLPGLWLRFLRAQVGWVNQPDGSMSPRIAPGDRVVHRVLQPEDELPDRGELVVVDGEDGPPVVRRVVGLPGERVDVRLGIARVDGRERFEDYRLPGRGRSLFLPEEVVGRDELYVLGDARLAEADARGVVPRSSVVGEPRWLLLPGDLVEQGHRIGEQLR